MEINTICCNKNMKDLGDVDIMNNNINFCHRFICLECGRFIDIIDYSLDDEELKNELDLYLTDEELKNSKIYNELCEVLKCA